MQLNHHESKFSPKTFPITLICDDITNTSNIGSLLRIADALGVEKVIFCGQNEILSQKSKRSSRATEKWVNYHFEKNIELAVSKLKSSHYILGLEITKNSKPLKEFSLSSKTNIALVIGNENFGIKPIALNLCDEIIHIEMYGKNSSMNVVQATGIALYNIANQLK